MKKTIAFVLPLLFNTHLSAWDVTFNTAFPVTCMENSCLDDETIKKIREEYNEYLKKNYIINNARPNELNDNTRERIIK